MSSTTIAALDTYFWKNMPRQNPAFWWGWIVDAAINPHRGYKNMGHVARELNHD